MESLGRRLKRRFRHALHEPFALFHAEQAAAVEWIEQDLFAVADCFGEEMARQPDAHHV